MKYKSTLVFVLISIILLTQVSYVRTQDGEAAEEPVEAAETVVEDVAPAEEAVEEAAAPAEVEATTGIYHKDHILIF